MSCYVWGGVLKFCGVVGGGGEWQEASGAAAYGGFGLPIVGDGK